MLEVKRSQCVDVFFKVEADAHIVSTIGTVELVVSACRFENALRRHCPTCCVPYIDTRLDCSLPRPRDSALFMPGHFGGTWGIVRDGMAANWVSQPSDCDVFNNGFLTRYADPSGCWNGLQYTGSMMQKAINCESYDDLCQPYDFSDFEADHGGPHMWISGHMAALPCAPLDPIFWSHHSFVDMLGERLKARLAPQQWRYPSNWMVPYMHRAGDPMRPFHYRNADGMYDEFIGKNYFYEISPADFKCSKDTDCSPSGLLWCDTASGTGACKAKCQPRGRCRTGVHAMCYCKKGTPRCNMGTCEC